VQEPGAKEKYHEAQLAYETLSDKEKRSMYDQVRFSNALRRRICACVDLQECRARVSRSPAREAIRLRPGAVCEICGWRWVLLGVVAPGKACQGQRRNNYLQNYTRLHVASGSSRTDERNAS